MENKNTQIIKDLPNKKLIITRQFAAPLPTVWKAWTQSEILDQWWAPKPWKAETKSMDFREGGSWLYAMAGPDGSKHWSKSTFEKIIFQEFFRGEDCFCDENGTVNPELPGSFWKNEFYATESGTKVIAEISFASEPDLEKIIEMGFEEGFTSALGNLDELFHTLS